MQTVLVTGGAGFIGANIVRRLLDTGHAVRVLDDLSRGRPRRLESIWERIEFHFGDIRNPEVVNRACAGVGRILHLAYVNGTRFFYEKPELVIDVAVRGMINVLDGCKAHGVRELILMSSSEVYQTAPLFPTSESVPLVVPDLLNPRFSYGGGKIACELMAINYGRTNFDRVVIVRPHNVYGADMGGEHVIPAITLRMRHLPIGVVRSPFQIQGTGHETRAFVHIDDFVDGFMRCADQGEHLGIYHVGNPEEVEIAQLTRLIAQILGRTIDIQPGELSSGSAIRRCPDISRAQALGYHPRIPLTVGLPDVVNWYNAHADLADLASNSVEARSQ